MSTDFSSQLDAAVAAADPIFRPALERLLRQVDPVDLQEREPRDIVGAAASIRELAGRRAPGDTLVAVFTSTRGEHGWTSRRTIVNICTDDSPFLVDSVTAAVARQGLAVHLLMHPVLSVRRDDDGELLEVDAHGGALESWIHLEIDRIPTEEGRAELHDRL